MNWSELLKCIGRNINMNNFYKNILFDLDGTITDSGEGITKCVQYALLDFGIEEKDFTHLCKFIGPPLKESFMQLYDFNERCALQAVEKYRERFKSIGIYENKLYPGIIKLLEKLSNDGRKLVVATAKPVVFARKILAHFHIDHYFEFVSGTELDGTRGNKTEVIAYALEKANVKDLCQTVMVGDREHDIKGARNVGICSIGVLYGFGDYDELKCAGADVIVDSIKQLEEVLLSNQ